MNNVILEVADRIATVTVSRPKALNALNTETLTELNACFSELEKRKDVRVVIVTGAGSKAFVAGRCPCWGWRRFGSWSTCPR